MRAMQRQAAATAMPSWLAPTTGCFCRAAPQLQVISGRAAALTEGSV